MAGGKVYQVSQVDPFDPHTKGMVYQVTIVGGGGGDVDIKKIVNKADVMPTPGSTYAGTFYAYAGATDSTYTHGYIYECVSISTYSSTQTFAPATVSGTVVTCTSDAFTSLASTYIHADITQIVSGTMTFDSLSDLWVFVGKDSGGNTVGTYQVYQTDYEDAGFTFTGTPAEGDVVAFTCTITESTSYAWVRINVQPLPTAAEIGAVTQTTHTISLLSTDWSSHTQTKTVTGVTADNTVIVSPASSSAADYAAAEILCTAQAANSLTFTCVTDPTNDVSVNVVILD